MDVQDYASTLRIHSEYLRTLAAQLETQVVQIAETLQERNLSTYAEARPQIDGFIQCSAKVSHTAEILHQRLVAFSKKIQRGEDVSPALPTALPGGSRPSSRTKESSE